MGAGKRRQIRKQICDILTEFVVKAYFERGVSGGELCSTAGEIMRLFPKPEVTTMHKKKTTHFKVVYYYCGKCGSLVLYEEWQNTFRFCPCCGRRILAVEDDTICQ